MVSKLSKEHDRRSGLSHYLYGVSTLFLSGVGIGGLSPLVQAKNWTYTIYFVCSLERYLQLSLHIALIELWSITINNIIMDGLMFIFSLGLIISSSFAIWLNTKSGQKWIDEL